MQSTPRDKSKATPLGSKNKSASSITPSSHNSKITDFLRPKEPVHAPNAALQELLSKFNVCDGTDSSGALQQGKRTPKASPVDPSLARLSRKRTYQEMVNGTSEESKNPVRREDGDHEMVSEDKVQEGATLTLQQVFS